MKACFLLQRNFAYIGHFLADVLKEKYGVTEFCGYVYFRPAFDYLRSQTDISYTRLLLDEDIHKEFRNETVDIDFLRDLEKEYGIPNLWPYLMNDRVVMYNQLVREYPYAKSPYTHTEMLQILQVKAKAIIAFLETEKPDLVFFSVVGAVGSMLLFHIAKKKGIRTIVVHPAYIQNTYLLSETYNTFSFLEKNLKNRPFNSFSSELQAKAQTFLDSFRDQPHPHWELAHPARQPVNRLKQFSFLLPKNLVQNIRARAKDFYRHFTSEERYDHDYIGPWGQLKDATKRKLRNARGLADLYDTPRSQDEPFVFFPLHFEPEISLSLLAPFFTDQISIIKLIARSLPVGYMLYVKEHPAMVVYRPRSYYKEIKKIPNVRLIDPAVTGYELIFKAKLVATITGTAGWEAILFKKPVITFGEVFYNNLSFVKHCRAPEELAYLMKEQLEQSEHKEEELLALLAGLFEESADVALQRLWEQEKDPVKRKKGLEPLADLLAKKLNLSQL